MFAVKLELPEIKKMHIPWCDCMECVASREASKPEFQAVHQGSSQKTKPNLIGGSQRPVIRKTNCYKIGDGGHLIDGNRNFIETWYEDEHAVNIILNYRDKNGVVENEKTDEFIMSVIGAVNRRKASERQRYFLHKFALEISGDIKKPERKRKFQR